MRKLSRQFVTVADEVHFLYPEGDWALKRVAKDPAHLFFKRFGEAMPTIDWNHPGTKQGVYMIGPNAEYLEGGGAISGNAKEVTERLRGALKAWKALTKAKKYANKPVPKASQLAPPEIAGKPLVLRVHLRDLPRSKGDDSGRRFTKRDRGGMWLNFTEWAWNENWITFDDPRAFVTKSKKAETLDGDVVMRLCRRVLVDNVRGQNPAWKAEHVKEAELTMQCTKVTGGRWHIEYRGQARMDSGSATYAPKLFGRAVWDPKQKQFESLDLVAIGPRKGAGRFNQRSRDKGQAPMGIALGLHSN